MTKDEILEVMKVVREAEDQLVEIRKALVPFDDSSNWNARYTDDSSRIDTFRYMNLDPRIVAAHGIGHVDKSATALREYWYRLRDLDRALA